MELEEKQTEEIERKERIRGTNRNQASSPRD